MRRIGTGIILNNQPKFSNPNLLLNSSLDFWTRGTTFTGTTDSTTYLADVWCMIYGNGYTVERSTDIPPNIPVNYSMKITTPSTIESGKDFFIIRQYLPYLKNGQYTLSYWIKGPQGAKASMDLNDSSESYTLTGDWQKCVRTTINNRATTSISHINFCRDIDTPGEYYIAAMKIEYGGLATPYFPPNYAEELNKISYYIRTIQLPPGPFVADTGGQLYIPIGNVKMRANPTPTVLNDIYAHDIETSSAPIDLSSLTPGITESTVLHYNTSPLTPRKLYTINRSNATGNILSYPVHVLLSAEI